MTPARKGRKQNHMAWIHTISMSFLFCARISYSNGVCLTEPSNRAKGSTIHTKPIIDEQFVPLCSLHYRQSDLRFSWVNAIQFSSIYIMILHRHMVKVMDSCLINARWYYLSNADSQSRADSRFAPNQWETAFLCNDVSHWLGTHWKSAL